MIKSNTRIVFMGTPDFAVPTLEALVNKGFNVVGVVTVPDKPAGRGKKITSSAVKGCALKLGLPVLQPEKLKDPLFLAALSDLKPDLQVVVAFRMLPEVVWSLPSMGTFNLHASLLPQYRGAAPINHALINGEHSTGITTFLLDKQIDTGKILFQEEVPILITDNVETLHDRLMTLGANLVCKTTEALISGQYQAEPQTDLISDLDLLKKAPKIFKEDCHINWNQTGEKVYNFIRGLSPYPAAFCLWKREEGTTPIAIKLFKAEFFPQDHNLSPGTLLNPDTNSLNVAVKDGFIQVLEIQQAGKKRMKVQDFLRGTGKWENLSFF